MILDQGPNPGARIWPLYTLVELTPSTLTRCFIQSKGNQQTIQLHDEIIRHQRAFALISNRPTVSKERSMKGVNQNRLQLNTQQNHSSDACKKIKASTFKVANGLFHYGLIGLCRIICAFQTLSVCRPSLCFPPDPSEGWWGAWGLVVVVSGGGDAASQVKLSGRPESHSGDRKVADCTAVGRRRIWAAGRRQKMDGPDGCKTDRGEGEKGSSELWKIWRKCASRGIKEKYETLLLNRLRSINSILTQHRLTRCVCLPWKHLTLIWWDFIYTWTAHVQQKWLIKAYSAA